MEKRFSVKNIGKAAAFTFLYTCLFLGITNFFHWYFTRQFLYEELITDKGYYMYDWVGNALGTVAMAVAAFAMEMLRLLTTKRAAPG